MHTGTLKGSGTDANVFITLFGSKGDTGEHQLRESQTNKNKFEQGKVCYLVIFIEYR